MPAGHRPAPLLAFHGSNDDCHSLTAMRRLHEMLEARGSAHALILDDVGHTNCYLPEMTAATVPFLRAAMGRSPGVLSQVTLDAIVNQTRRSDGLRGG